MSNASLKEQLQALASQLVVSTPSQAKKPLGQHNQANKVVSRAKSDVKRPTRAIEKPKKEKPQWLQYAQSGVELLKRRFPACFKGAHDLSPLKVGIKQDLVKFLSTVEDITSEDKACMIKSLAYYVNGANYHKKIVAGTVRVDLDGNPAGIVSQEEANYSVERQRIKQQHSQQAKLNTTLVQPKEDAPVS